MEKERLSQRPLDLQDIVDLGKKKYEDGASPEEVKAWLGDYHPPVSLCKGANAYYDYMINLCEECQEPWEAKRLSYLQIMINQKKDGQREVEEKYHALIAQYFQVDDDVEVLENLSEICYQTSRFFEYVIIELFLSQHLKHDRQLHDSGRYRINMSYFIEQLQKASLWILPVVHNAVEVSELFGNLLSRMGHKVVLVVQSEVVESDQIPSDHELLEASMKGRQEYSDITVIPSICVKDKSGRSKDITAELIRVLCHSESKTDYANVLTAGESFDLLQETKIKRDLERLSRYEGEIFQKYMVFGRIGNYMSYLEQIYQRPMQTLLDMESSCKYSIVIPARNSGKYLYHTIRTCLNQRYQGEYEILISDNSTEGNTEIWELCQRMNDKHIRYIKVPREINLEKSFEYACLNAKGEYFLSIGSDDGVLPWTLQVLDQVVSEYPDEAVIRWELGNYMWPDYDGSEAFKANMVFVPCKYEKENYRLTWEDMESLLFCALQSPSYMYALPSSYLNSCYKKSYLREILARTGRLRNGLCHDIYMGVVTTLMKKKVLTIHYPLTIAAQSGISLGARSNFVFDNDLKTQKNEHSMTCGVVALSPIERYLPEISMDYGLLYQSVLRMISLGVLPEELLEIMDWKIIYKNISEQFKTDKIVYDELINKLRYAATNLGEEFLNWFDEEIYNPGREKKTYEEKEKVYSGWEDTVGENGCVALTLDKYGVKNIYDAVKMFELITEL